MQSPGVRPGDCGAACDGSNRDRYVDGLKQCHAESCVNYGGYSCDSDDEDGQDADCTQVENSEICIVDDADDNDRCTWQWSHDLDEEEHDLMHGDNHIDGYYTLVDDQYVFDEDNTMDGVGNQHPEDQGCTDCNDEDDYENDNDNENDNTEDQQDSDNCSCNHYEIYRQDQGQNDAGDDNDVCTCGCNDLEDGDDDNTDDYDVGARHHKNHDNDDNDDEDDDFEGGANYGYTHIPYVSEEYATSSPTYKYLYNTETLIDCYYEGEVHIPVGICPGLLDRMLRQRGLSMADLATCCRVRLERENMRFFKMMEYSEKNSSFDIDFGGKQNEDMSTKEKIRRVLEDPFSSIAAKVWVCFTFGLVLCTILVFSIQTIKGDIPQNNSSNTLEGEVRYEESQKRHQSVKSHYMGQISSGKKKFVREYIKLNQSSFDVKNIPVTSKQQMAILLEFTTVAILLIEFAVRYIVSNDRRAFKRNFANVFELLSFIVSLIALLFYCKSVFLDHRQTFTVVMIVIFMKLVRMFRLIRVLRHYPNIMVIWRTLVDSRREIMLLYVVMLMGMLFSACLVYYFEQETDFVTSLPLAYWWAITTMTTVGYGDVVPKTLIGRLIASLTAVSGIMIVVIVVPVISNNFLLIYECHRAQFACRYHPKIVDFCNDENPNITSKCLDDDGEFENE